MSATRAMVRAFLRSREVRTAGLLVGVLVTVVLTLLNTVSALQLSAEQEAEQSLGSFDAAVQDALQVGEVPSAGQVEQVRAAAREAGATRLGARVTTKRIRVDDRPPLFTGGVSKVVMYFEDFLGDGLPATDRVISGRLPERPGEVALSTAMADELGHPETVTLFGRKVRLTVVGIVEPTYGEDSLRLIAGRGTWASMPADEIRRTDPVIDGGLTWYWAGEGHTDVMLAGLAAANPNTTGMESLQTGLVTRSGLDGATESGLRQALVAPALVLVGLGGMLVVNAAVKPLRRVQTRLFGIGVGQPVTRGAAMISLAVACATGAILGVGAAWAVSLGVQHLVLPQLLDQPPGPIRAVAETGALVSAVSVAATLATAFVGLQRPVTRRPSRRALTPRVPWALIRRCVAVIGLAWILPTVLTTTDLTVLIRSALPLTAALLLVVPDLMRASIALLPKKRSLSLAARRLMQADRTRFAVAATGLAICVAMPAVWATIETSSHYMSVKDNIATVPKEQMVIEASGLLSAETMRKYATALKKVPGLAPAVEVGWPGDEDTYVALYESSESGSSRVQVIEPEDGARLLGDAWTDEATRTLRTGGMVTMGPAGTTIQKDDDEPITVPTLALEVSEEQAYMRGAFITTDTLSTLGIGVSEYDALIYTGVTKELEEQAVAEVEAAGLSPTKLQRHTPPPPVEYPASSIVTLAGLLAAVLVLLWVVLGGQAKRLREYATRLLAIGLSPHWSGGLLAIQQTTVILTGLFSGLAAGVGTVAVFAHLSMRGMFELTLPWTELAIITTGAITIAITAALLSLRSLRPETMER